MAETIKIGGELESTATGNVVASTNHIKDRNKNKYQSDINVETDAALADRYTKEETYNKEQLNNLITTPDQKYVSVSATSQTTSIEDVLPVSGASNTIYRIGSWDGSQYRPTVYSEYTWDGSSYTFLCVKSQIGEVFDISVYNNNAKYDTLADALGTNGEHVPQSIRRGGMSVKFVQSSDNKYVQYRLMSNTFNTNVANWEGNSDNWYVASRASITFNESSIYIGNGDLYFRKGNAYISINHVATTYNFEGTSHLCLSTDTRTISVKSASEIKAGDIDLIYYDNQKGFSYGLLFDYYLDSKTKADNWYVASRADIVFNESSIYIGQGYLYFRKGNTASLNIIHTETTYSFSGSSHLCLNLNTRTISIKSTLETGDVDLIYYDSQKGFCYGLLFDYYLNNRISDTKSEISEMGELTAQNIPISAVNTLNNQYITSDGILTNANWCKVVGPLNVLKGQTVVFETKISNSAVICTTDESMTSFTPVVVQPSTANATRKRYEYYADEDCYVALSGRTNDFWFAIAKYHVPTFTYLDNRISEVKTEISNTTVPSFVFEDGMEAYQRIINWANSDSIFLLGFITDVHSGGTAKYVHNKYLSALGEPLGFDILCNGGDIGLDTPATPDTHSRFEMMYNTKKGMIGNIPWIYVKGNHERLQSMAELGQIYNKSFNSIYGNFVFGDIYGLYGYRDYTDKKIRIIFLNTSDNDAQEHYSMSATQLQWLSNTLLNTPSDYGIVILTHRMIDSIGRWKSNMSGADGEPWDTYRSILKDFVARTSGSGVDGITWDFSTAEAKLICNLAGDSHFNSYVKRDGVNYIVRQGMQNAGSEMQGDATAASFDWETKICLDALAIKKDGIAKVFRVGAGGSDYDLSFTY